jgi:hypothetical protein
VTQHILFRKCNIWHTEVNEPSGGDTVSRIPSFILPPPNSIGIPLPFVLFRLTGRAPDEAVILRVGNHGQSLDELRFYTHAECIETGHGAWCVGRGVLTITRDTALIRDVVTYEPDMLMHRCEYEVIEQLLDDAYGPGSARSIKPNAA